MNDHLPIVKATIEDGDGHGAVFIECTSCPYKTGRQRSKKQAWADFRAHSRCGMTIFPEPPAGTAENVQMF